MLANMMRRVVHSEAFSADILPMRSLDQLL